MAEQKKSIEEQIKELSRTPIDESKYCTPEQVKSIMQEQKERNK